MDTVTLLKTHCLGAQARAIRRRQATRGQKGAAELPVSSSAKELD